MATSPRVREDMEYEHREGGGLTPEPQSEKLAKKATMKGEMIGRQHILSYIHWPEVLGSTCLFASSHGDDSG